MRGGSWWCLFCSKCSVFATRGKLGKIKQSQVKLGPGSWCLFSSKRSVCKVLAKPSKPSFPKYLPFTLTLSLSLCCSSQNLNSKCGNFLSIGSLEIESSCFEFWNSQTFGKWDPPVLGPSFINQTNKRESSVAAWESLTKTEATMAWGRWSSHGRRPVQFLHFVTFFAAQPILAH